METDMKYTVSVNHKWCKNCGICAAFCPKNVFELIDGKITIVYKDRCIGCGRCEQLCPDYAINIGEKNENN